MRFALVLPLALAACTVEPKSVPPPPQPLELTGIDVDGTGIDNSTLKGKPWVIDLWRVA